MNWIRAVSCWGNEASLEASLALAAEWGFEAVEGPLWGDPAPWRSRWRDAGVEWIAEIATGCGRGEYVPDWDSTPAAHLDDFRRKLERALEAGAGQVTVLAGCDAWEFGVARDFLGELLEAGGGVALSVETHRGRPTFHPVPTLRLLDELPALRLTLDLSHWCVVCERPVAADRRLVDRLRGRVGHLHARVGYEQGPQVPDPRVDRHRADAAAHLAAWHRIAAGSERFTVTPEFGPDGYLQRNPTTGRGVADLRELNRWTGDWIDGRETLV